MPIKHQDFIIRGMHRDMTESAFNPEFAYENQNLRITTDPNAEDTRTGEVYAMTNERGNKYVPIYGLDATGHNADGQYGDMNGVPIGQALLNNQWVVFMTDRDKEIFIDGQEDEIEDFPIEKTNITWLKTNSLDRIYRLWFNNDVLNGELLYEGHLNFSTSYPLETLPYFENQDIQKVYWTDGINQPRMINIVEKPEKKAHWNDYYFDFVSNIHLTDNITIEENETGGMFPAGKIQWYFTYIMEFGPESNIFHSTPLYDIKFRDRGASPEEWTTQSFKISLSNLDRQFDYVCIYSVLRTSIDNVPNCKLVAKLPINSDGTAMFVDTNLTGEVIEPQSLFYKGGETINAYTFENKDNTMFLGNYSIMRSVIDDNTRRTLRNYAFKANLSLDDPTYRYLKDVSQYPFSRFIFTNGSDLFGPNEGNWATADENIEDIYGSGYPYSGRGDKPNLVKKFRTVNYFGDKDTISSKSYFRKNNIYRVGIQFQYYTGRWSEVVWLGDYKCNENMITGDEYTGNEVKGFTLGYLKLDNTIQSVLEKLVSIGYRKVRPVVIYPNIANRVSLCQGFVNNTIAMSPNLTKVHPDWFIRESYCNENDANVLDWRGAYLDKGVIFYKSGVSPEGEFERPIYTDVICSDSWFTPEHGRIFPFETSMLCDLYSPDVEFNDSLQIYNYKNCKISLNNTVSTWNNTSLSSRRTEVSSVRGGHLGYYYNNKYYFSSNIYNGLDVPENPSMNTGGYNSHIVGGYYWSDAIPNYRTETNDTLQMEVPVEKATEIDLNFSIFYPVTLWQHSGSISYDSVKEPYKSTLKSNKTLNYIQTRQERNVNEDTIFTPVDMACWNGGNQGLTLSNKSIMLYNGWVNSIVSHNPNYYYIGYLNKDESRFPWTTAIQKNQLNNRLHSIVTLKPDGTPDDWGWDSNGESTWFNGNLENQSYITHLTSDIKYKTVPHIIFSTDQSSIYQRVNKIDQILGRYSYNNIETMDYKVPRLAIVDIIQDVATDSIFGGYTEEILQRNSFIPCGDAVSIAEMYIEHLTDDPNSKPVEKYRAVDLRQSPIELVWDTGDTYYQEYECLKTYPYTLEDENCVTEIIKFYVETYTNLNGRYDRNKGNPNFGTLPSNWNLINPIYNQKNNFMEYHGLDLSKNGIDDFHNSFTWTLTKWAGDEIDRWTQITLANTMDVDGVRGGITKIINYNDMLLAFQPKGLSQILYNEREQIATGSGVPIELSNSGKVSGTRYLSNLAGCNNKWSICKTEKALYFVDDVNKQIMAFNGQLNNLSDDLGFHSWINVKANLSVWNPIIFSNFISHFDPYNEDVMFYYKDNALSYSEQLQCFDSFFSYGYVPYYMAFNNSAFTLSDRDSDHKDTYRVWEQHKGYHNYFYVHDRTVYENGEVKLKGRLDDEDKPTYFGYEPYWTTLMVNPDMPYDKVFTNIDMRTDMWDWEGKLMEETFSHIEVWNEFQYNKSLLTKFTDIPKLHMPAKHSILKKKMRVWYVDIPRDSSDVQSHIWRGLKQNLPERNGLLCNRWKNRDRMRNTWLYLKLSKELYDEGLVEKTQWYKMPFRTDSKQVIHHIGISYFI